MMTNTSQPVMVSSSFAYKLLKFFVLQIRDNVHKNLEKKTTYTYCRHTDTSEETFAWRCQIRKSFYLLYPDVGNHEHLSIQGHKLSAELINFSEFCKENRNKYILDPSCNLQKLYITEKEKMDQNDITKKNKTEIKHCLSEQLLIIKQTDLNLHAQLKERYEKSIKSISTKAEMLAVYHQLEEIIEYLEERCDSGGIYILLINLFHK